MAATPSDNLTIPRSDFLLRQECHEHHKAIRSLCVLKEDSKIITASTDGEIIVWSMSSLITDSFSSPDDNIDSYHLEKRLQLFDDSVYIVMDGGITSNISSFFAGGKSKTIIWATSDGCILKSFIGHTGPVCSLNKCDISISSNLTTVLVSGSWDSTARIWDLDTSNVLFILKGHTYAVTLFSWRPTYSASNEGDEIITGSQDGTIHFWSSKNTFSNPIASISKAHSDIIRGFTLLKNDSVVSCSNDGTLRIWNLRTRQHVSTIQAHDAFIFDVITVPKNNRIQTILCSASDDQTVKIWDCESFKELQCLPHSSSIWKITHLHTGDLVTGGEDGILRIWTTDHTKALPEEFREKLFKNTGNNVPTLSNKESINPNALPHVDTINTLLGTHIGQHRLFLENNTAVAYKWLGTSWIRIGEVIGTSGMQEPSPPLGEYYEGDLLFPSGYYDYVFKVDIGENEPLRLLPYKVGQDPLTVSSLFCTREKIPKSSLSEIQQFIINNSVQSIQPKVNNDSSPIHQSQQNTFKHIPLREYVVFSNYNGHAIQEKLLELNEKQADHLKLTDLEKTYLTSLINKMESSSFLTKDIRRCELDLLFDSNLLKWDSQDLFPMIDLWRIIALHSQSSDIHKKCDGGWKYISTALRLACHTESSSLTICAYRYVANLYQLPTNRSAILIYSFEVLQFLIHPPKGKLALTAWVSILMNFSLAVSQTQTHACHRGGSECQFETIIQEFFKAIRNGLEMEEMHIKARYNTLLAFGTFLLIPTVQSNLSQFCHIREDLHFFVDHFSSFSSLYSGDPDLLSCMHEIKALCDECTF